jgi:hypothetical protein
VAHCCLPPANGQLAGACIATPACESHGSVQQPTHQLHSRRLRPAKSSQYPSPSFELEQGVTQGSPAGSAQSRQLALAQESTEGMQVDGQQSPPSLWHEGRARTHTQTQLNWVHRAHTIHEGPPRDATRTVHDELPFPRRCGCCFFPTDEPSSTSDHTEQHPHQHHNTPRT